MSDASPGPGARAQKESVTVRHDGHVVAAAEVTTPPEPHGTASVALTTPHEAPSDARSELVDQVLDHPGVRQCDNVHVVVPVGDGASITRLQERTTNFTARAAGASSVVEADVSRPSD